MPDRGTFGLQPVDHTTFDLDPRVERVCGLADTFSVAMTACGSQYGFKEPHDIAKYVMFNCMPIPVFDTKNTEPQMVRWIPSTRIRDGVPGPWQHYKLVVIGKMPGMDEIMYGRTYCGPVGQELLNMAYEVGVGDEIADAYGTNVLRFLPPDGGKILRPQHVKDCRYLLMQELAAVKPDFILCLGTDAMKAVFGKKFSMSKVRSHLFVIPSVYDIGSSNIKEANSVDPLEYQSGVKLFATVHPAAVLREEGFRPGFRADLTKFAAALSGSSGGNPVSGRGCDYRYIDDIAELRRTVDEVLSIKPRALSVDCEWGGGDFISGKIRTVQFSWGPRKAACVIYRRQYLHDAVKPSEMYLFDQELKRLFMAPGIQLVGHNIRADALWLQSKGIDIMSRVVMDTMLADHAFNENAEHNLESCAIRYTDMGRYDWELRKWFHDNKIGEKELSRVGYRDVPDHLLHPYANCDADASYRIFEVLEETFKLDVNKQACRCYYNVIHPCMIPLHEMERTGFLADRERMERMVYRYEAKKLELIEMLRDRIKQADFNVRSIPQVSNLLYGKPDKGGLGLLPLKTTEKPARMWEDILCASAEEQARVNPSTDTESLEYLSVDSDIASILRNIRIVDQITKNFLRLPEEDEVTGHTTYVDGLVGQLDYDGRIRTSLNQMSETGRQKSSNPNCFEGSVEALTQCGWVPFAEVYLRHLGIRRDESSCAQLKLAQFDENTNEIDFAIPLDYQQVETDELVHVFTDKQIDLLMTPDHRCLIRNRDGKFKFVAANAYPEDHEQLQAGRYVGGQVAMRESQVILACALQADGHVTKWGSYDFGFSKKRKAQRLEWALIQENISYSKYDSDRFRFYIFRERIPEWWKNKQFGDWLLELDRPTFDLFAEEVWFWDGAWKRRSMFASSIKKNSDWVQILTLLSNRRAKLRKYISNTGSISWQVDASDQNYSMTTNRIIEPIHTQLQAYCVTMPKGTVIVRYNGRVAITGQCQNFPKKQNDELDRIMGKDTPHIRSCFMCPPGTVLIEADYKSAELFTLGFLSNCGALVRDSRSDLHARGAVTRMGAPKWEGFDEGKNPPGSWKDKYGNLRLASKTISFGIPYQRGAKAIAREIEKTTKGAVRCDTDKARGFIDGFYEQYPEVLSYVEMCKKSVARRSLFNPYGRTRHFAHTDERSLIAAQQREAVNFPIQSTVADTLNVSMYNLWCWRQFNPGLADYRILLAVHDAIILEVSIGSVRTVVNRVLPECLRFGSIVPAWQPTPDYVPTSPFNLDIDIEIMLRWGEKLNEQELLAIGLDEEIAKRYAH